MPGTEWLTEPLSTSFSHLSLQYFPVAVSVFKAGAAYNPTSDTVKFAFMPTPTQVPLPGDFVTGSWEANVSSVIYPYNAKCLVGPGGTITLGTGTYIVYLQVTDSPEIPVLAGGQLQVS